MTRTSPFSRFGRLVLFQGLGNGVLLLLAGGLLLTFGAQGWRFALSVLAAFALAVAALFFFVATFRALRPCALRPPWVLACLLLAALLALWWLTLRPIAFGRAHEPLAAAYFTEQWPGLARVHVTNQRAVIGYPLGYSSLVAWQERIYDCLQYVLAGLWLPLALEMCACGLAPGWLLRALRVYRRMPYWISMVGAGFVAETLTWSLAGWPSSEGSTQTVGISVGAHLLAAYSLDILLWCLLLMLIAHYLAPPVLRTKPAR